jgi:hypothetical protein
MRRVLIFLLIAAVLPSVLLSQSTRGPSTPEERQRAVAVAKTLEQDPLGANKDDRQWIIVWLIQIPDITVTACGATMTWEENYRYSGELMATEMSGSAAYIIQHPEKAKDKEAAGKAGFESALKAYSVILASDAASHSKKMDEMLNLQASGGIADYVHKQWKKQCK